MHSAASHPHARSSPCPRIDPDLQHRALADRGRLPAHIAATGHNGVSKSLIFDRGSQHRSSIGVRSPTSCPPERFCPYTSVHTICIYSNMIIANRTSPVRPLIARFRPLQGEVRTPVRGNRAASLKPLIEMALSKKSQANSGAKSIIHPVFPLLQGSGPHCDHIC